MPSDPDLPADLRRVLMETIQEVREGEITARDGAAVASLAKNVIDSMKLELTIASLCRTQEAQVLSAEIPAIEDGANARQRREQTTALLSPPAETPDTAPVADDALRARIHDYLSEAGPRKPALIASDLEITPGEVQLAVNHKWFAKTPDGIAVANQRPAVEVR